MDFDAYWSQVEGAVKAPGGQVEGIAHCFLSDLFGRPAHVDPSRASPTDRAGKQPLPARESSFVCTVAHCFLRALSSRALQRHFHSAWTAQDGAPTKEQLHERFVKMVSSLYDSFDAELREVSRNSGAILSESGGQCVPTLVDAVLSLVYGRTRFNVLRPSMSTSLMGQQTPGSAADALSCAFRAFTAQAREAVIASVVRPHSPFQRSRGCWSVGDYAVELSSGGETLYLDLFAFAEGREAARDDDDAGVATRRVSLSMRLEQVFSARDAVGTARPSDFVLSVQATVSVSTFRSSGGLGRGVKYAPKKNISKWSEMPSSHRARAWSEMGQLLAKPGPITSENYAADPIPFKCRRRYPRDDASSGLQQTATIATSSSYADSYGSHPVYVYKRRWPRAATVRGHARL
ncbi:hypothetical protein PR002_g24237 [Phytophthora rubi]|uniref:Uncharacterized protein n=1 Tax=Phytophthora rubi TaxID=129364 RepID=A0A6A3IAN9_9STRA|nr:hypothetical protein PR002_g24237 [Phytophthora rubi]